MNTAAARLELIFETQVAGVGRRGRKKKLFALYSRCEFATADWPVLLWNGVGEGNKLMANGAKREREDGSNLEKK